MKYTCWWLELGLEDTKKWRVSGSMDKEVKGPSTGRVWGTNPSAPRDSWKTHDCKRWTNKPPRGKVVTGLGSKLRKL